MHNIDQYSENKAGGGCTCSCAYLAPYHIPHGRAVKVHHHPLGRVESEGMSIVHPGHEVPVLRADERRACICCVYVEPHVSVPTCGELLLITF